MNSFTNEYNEDLVFASSQPRYNLRKFTPLASLSLSLFLVM